MSSLSQKLSVMVRRLTCNNPGPYTGSGTNTYIIGKEKVAIIDPGPQDPVHLRRLLSEVRNETVCAILVTHTHHDHSPLAQALSQATGAKTYGYGPHGYGRFGSHLDWRSLPPPYHHQNALDASGDLAFRSDVLLRDGECLEIGGFTLEAVYTPGHSANHLAFCLREENMLFCGDHVMSSSTPVIAPPDGKMSEYLHSLSKLLKREEKLYWPGHGAGISNPKALIRATINHRIMREKAILRAVKAGHKTLREIVAFAYPTLSPVLQQGAQATTVSHLEHLVEKGEIIGDFSENGHVFYH